MAQQQNSPSLPQHDGRNHQPHGVRSDSDVPIDPSIASASPTYPYPQHSPYGPNPDMAHGYSHPSGGMYPQTRPDWAGYGGHGASPITPGHMYGSPANAPQQRPNQVCLDLQRKRNRKCTVDSKARLTYVKDLGMIQTSRKVGAHPFFHNAPFQSACATSRPCLRALKPLSYAHLRDLKLMRGIRFTLLYRFLELSNTRDLAGDTKKSSACTSVAGTAAKRRMVRSTTLMPMSQCKVTDKSALQRVSTIFITPETTGSSHEPGDLSGRRELDDQPYTSLMRHGLAYGTS